MAHVIGELVAPMGTYLKDGQEKTRWQKCGILLQTDKGMRVKIEVLPVSRPEAGGLWLQVFEKDDKPQQNQRQSQRSAPQQSQQSVTAEDFSDDNLPF